MINFEACKYVIQDYLRVIIERYPLNTFIIITKNYHSIRDAIRSRCVAIRMPGVPSEILSDFKTPHDKMIENLVDIYEHDFEELTPIKLKNIKQISSDIHKYNLSMTNILRDLVAKLMIHVKWHHAIKYDIISYVTEQEYIYIKSYRKLIITESIFINLYYRLAAANYEV